MSSACSFGARGALDAGERESGGASGDGQAGKGPSRAGVSDGEAWTHSVHRCRDVQVHPDSGPVEADM